MLIGEVARRSGVSARMLRHYDALGLVVPSGRTTSGYRAYSDDDLGRLVQVEALRSLGLGLGDVGRALEDPSREPGRLLDELLAASRARIAREQEIVDRLRQVRETAVAAWTDVPRVVALIRELRADDPSQRQRVALSTDPVDGDLAAVLAQAVLGEADPNTAGALRWALERTGGDAVAVLAPALDDDEPAVRARAVRALAELPGDTVTAVLLAAIDHTDADIRREAALALGRRGDRRAVVALGAVIAEGPGDVEAGELLGSLALRHGIAAEVVDVLRERLALADEPDGARSRLTQALAELDGPEGAALLDALVDDADSRVARVARYLRDRPQSQVAKR